MNAMWLRAVFLACVFGAVLLGVETLVAWLARGRSEHHAINERLRQLSSRGDREQTLHMLRLATQEIAGRVPGFFRPFGRKFDRMMTAAQIGIALADADRDRELERHVEPEGSERGGEGERRARSHVVIAAGELTALFFADGARAIRSMRRTFAPFPGP